jgi:cytidylate kinase
MDVVGIKRTKGIVIAIDGPAGSGKSTLAKLLAERLKFVLLDSGALYRAFSIHLSALGISPDASTVDNESLMSFCPNIVTGSTSMKIFISNKDMTDKLRDESVGVAASKFSTKPEVREALLPIQRSVADRNNLVAEGRDMGTVVFSDAEFKFYITAALPVRARRRYEELRAKGIDTDERSVRSEMEARDERDKSRSTAPLRPAEDAVIIDSSGLSPGNVLKTVLELVEPQIGKC